MVQIPPLEEDIFGGESEYSLVVAILVFVISNFFHKSLFQIAKQGICFSKSSE